MPEILVAPDVEEAAIVEIRTALATLPNMADVTVSTTVDDGRCVRVLKTGGQGWRRRILYDAQVTVEAWAPTETEAGRLADFSVAALHAASDDGRLAFLDLFDVSDISTTVNLPDPERPDDAHYQATLGLLVSGA